MPSELSSMSFQHLSVNIPTCAPLWGAWVELSGIRYHKGAGLYKQPRRLRPQCGPISHPQNPELVWFYITWKPRPSKGSAEQGGCIPWLLLFLEWLHLCGCPTYFGWAALSLPVSLSAVQRVHWVLSPAATSTRQPMAGLSWAKSTFSPSLVWRETSGCSIATFRYGCGRLGTSFVSVHLCVNNSLGLSDSSCVNRRGHVGCCVAADDDIVMNDEFYFHRFFVRRSFVDYIPL